MAIFTNSDFDNHESVHAFFDAKTGLKGFIGVHSTALGPSFGGCRMWNYENENAAITDVLRLSRGMSYKNALAGLNFGGGKAVIIGNSKTDKTPDLFKAFGRAVDRLGGSYITAEDVGIDVADMRSVAKSTKHVSGIEKKEGVIGGDPSPKTAFGVYHGLRAAAKFKFGRDDLEGLKIAVQGVGHVGYHLCKYLYNNGAKLFIADINKDNVQRACSEFNAEIVDVNEIIYAQVDILAPCALGGILDLDTVSKIQAKVVAGAANNQLKDDTIDQIIFDRGIVYAPDYVVNSGGIISAAAEHEGSGSEDAVMSKIASVYDRTLEILQKSQDDGIPTGAIADKMAREIIERGKH